MNTLVICILVSLMAASVVVCDKKDDIMAILKACNMEVKITDAEMKMLDEFVNAESMLNIPNPTDNLKCHMKCMMEKGGILKAGVFNDEAMLKSLREMPNVKDHLPAVEKAVSECKNEKGMNDCDMAYKINMCFNKHKAAMFAA